MKRDPRRAPKPPPFPVGARLRYRGADRLHCEGVALLEPGLEVVVDEVRPGRQGTGRWVQPHEFGGDPDDDPIQDDTRDGYSVYHVTTPSGRRLGRCINAADKREWLSVRGPERP